MDWSYYTDDLLKKICLEVKIYKYLNIFKYNDYLYLLKGAIKIKLRILYKVGLILKKLSR